MNNTSEYVIDNNDNCVWWGKVVTEADNGAACQWGSRWELNVCAELNATEYSMLSGSSPKISFSAPSANLKHLNVQESTSDEGQERKQHDIDEVMSIFQQYLG